MPIPKQFLAGLEPVFWLSGTTELRFPVELHRPLADYFQHCITRQPSDLRSHVRRIFLAYEFESRADLYAALIDLFLALGRHGHPLRTRLLELAKPRLEEGQYAFLRQSLGTGLSISPACNVTGSLLSQGVAGHTNLIKPAPEAAPEAVRDPCWKPASISNTANWMKPASYWNGPCLHNQSGANSIKNCWISTA